MDLPRPVDLHPAAYIASHVGMYVLQADAPVGIDRFASETLESGSTSASGPQQDGRVGVHDWPPIKRAPRVDLVPRNGLHRLDNKTSEIELRIEGITIPETLKRNIIQHDRRQSTRERGVSRRMTLLSCYVRAGTLFASAIPL